jgi:parallel beta-helix repeat protein
MTKKTSPSVRKKRSLNPRHNTRPIFILLFLPLVIGCITVALIATGLYARSVTNIGSKRLVTENWQIAADLLEKSQPTYERKYAYYKVKDGQTLEQVAAYFSVNIDKLRVMNPGKIVAGTTVKIPPVESPLKLTAGPNGKISKAVITQKGNLLRVTNKYNLRQPIVTTIPDLAAFLASYGAIEQTGPTSYRINKAISLDGDIRLDLTKATVSKLELRSSPGDVTCLCMDESAALIDGVNISSYDPATQKPDLTYEDGRAFVRMKNGRMDVLNANFSYLGNSLKEQLTNEAAKTSTIQNEGGVYGVSWRIADDQLGIQIATGWVEKSRFTYNHFGAFTYGSSGMMWRNNNFSHNEVYGLDPHDDSNNALIEDNVFEHNGKHGFIVSKRCNYNIIRNNLSYDNKLHGFMLHQDSAYNVIEDNVAYGNTDNFVIYESNFNTIRDNTSYSPKSSHIRVNRASHNTTITGNKLYGGPRGIYLYDGPASTYIANNTIYGVAKVLHTHGTQNAVLSQNALDSVRFDIATGDRLIFGDNTIKKGEFDIPVAPSHPKGYSL